MSNENRTPESNADQNVQTAGQNFIAAVHAKMSNLVSEFASGEINRTQFHHLYDRYQRQIMTVAQLITESDPNSWREAVVESEDTYHIRKRLTAKALGMSIYDNESGMPIETLGEFAVDTALIVPMLSSYRSATAEIFRAGMRSTEMENGNWLCFVPGNYTTLIALFSLEPSDNQMQTIERMHKDFEAANKAALESRQADPTQLAYPFLSFLKKAKQTGSDSLVDAALGNDDSD
jgi:hypothetical protein